MANVEEITLHAAVDVSVVVPSYRGEATLATCIDSLLAQRYQGSFEVVVCASADQASALPSLNLSDPRLTVLTAVPRLSAAAARNRAVAHTTGEMIAFTDADVIAPPHWISALVRASGGHRCVAGSVRNGTPNSVVGTVEYLMGFLDLHPGRPARTAWHGATCNLLLPRRLWERYGPFPEDMGGGEDTLLTVAARADGLFVFEPDAWVAHHNRTRGRVMLRHQYEFGCFTAHLARRSPYKLRPLVRYSPLAPVAGLARIASLYARVVAWDRSLLRGALSGAPLLVCAMSCWTAGLAREGLRLDARLCRRWIPRPSVTGAPGGPNVPRPFFVVGSTRSGSTLLRLMLDSHSRLAVPPESYFVIDLARRRNASLDDILAHPRYLTWGFDSQLVRAQADAQRPLTYAEAVRTVFGAWAAAAAAAGKTRWGDKTPDYVLHIQRLARLLPDAQFIHLIRDGREVAASLVERDWGPSSAVVGAFWWRWKVATGRRSGRRLGPARYLEVRLEDLVADPSQVLGRICRFLGEDFEDAMLSYHQRAPELLMVGGLDRDPSSVRHLSSEPTAGLRDWRTGLSPRQRRVLEAACRRQLRRAGYPVPPWDPLASLEAAAAAAKAAVKNCLDVGPRAFFDRIRPNVWWS